MDQTSSSAITTNTLHCALELSRNSWLLAIQFPDREQPSLYPIEGGNTEKLMARLTAALVRNRRRDVSTGVFVGGVLSTLSAWVMGFASFVARVRAGAEVLASPRLVFVLTQFPWLVKP